MSGKANSGMSPCEVSLALRIRGTQRSQPVSKWPGGITETLPPGLSLVSITVPVDLQLVQPLSEEFLPLAQDNPGHLPSLLPAGQCTVTAVSWCVCG